MDTLDKQLKEAINQAREDLLQYQDGGQDEMIDVVIADLTAAVDEAGQAPGQTPNRPSRDQGMMKDQIIVAKNCDRRAARSIYNMCSAETRALIGKPEFIYQSMLFCAMSVIKRAGRLARIDAEVDEETARGMISRIATLYKAEFMAEVTKGEHNVS